MQHSNRLAKCHILRRREEFNDMFRDPHYRASRKGIRMLGRPNQCGYPRIGLVVAKKYIPQATQRNRIKRQVREFFRERLADAHGDIVVIVYQKTLSHTSNADIRSGLERVWSKLVQQQSAGPRTRDAVGSADPMH